LLVILTALRDPILKLIEMGRGNDSETRFRRRIMETHKKILDAIQTHNGPLADQISRRHIFDLYAKLVSPTERARLENLLT